MSRANDGLYPNGFYRLMSVLATTNVDRSVVVMRMASWLVALSLLLAAGLVARRAARPALALAALTTLVPLGVYLFASTNPSGIAIAGIGAYWVAAMTVLEGGGSTARRATVVAVLLGSAALALVSRSDAGLYLAVASLAAWLSAGGYRPPFARTTLLVGGVAVVGIVSTVLGRQNERWAGDLDVQQGQTRTALLFEGVLDLPRRVLGSIGLDELGWLDTPMPALVRTLMLLAFGGALVIGLGAATREKWLALVVVAGTLVGLPLLVLSSGQNVQPRYVLPLLPILMGTALIARPVDPPVRVGRCPRPASGVRGRRRACRRVAPQHPPLCDRCGRGRSRPRRVRRVVVESRARPDGHLVARHDRFRRRGGVRVPPAGRGRSEGTPGKDGVGPAQLTANRVGASSWSSEPVYS